MMKKYIIPSLRIIDLSLEGMIAGSPLESLDADAKDQTSTQWTQKGESTLWDRDGVWK